LFSHRFFTDTTLSFLPLVINSLTFTSVKACSSLDFSLHFYHPNSLDLNDWLYHEQTSEVGSGGKTFSNGRVWSRDGQIVAKMSQMGIMRKWEEGELEELVRREKEKGLKSKL